MVGQRLFKTRICLLYRKGRCHRQTCSFAHGDAELRRYNTSSSFNGRRDYRGADLREKLGRQRSPPRRNSHGHISPRFGKKSDLGHRKRHQFDGESDLSGSLRSSDGAEPQTRERKPSSSEFKDVHDDQLKQVQSEIDMLEDHKHQLQIFLEESVQETNSLNSKIEELEMQLSTEKEEFRRVTSKIRKFVKANNRHAKIQDELKRSQARVQRIGEQLGSDARADFTEEEDISINNILLSDEETLDNHLIGPQRKQFKISPTKKRTRPQMVEAYEKSKQASYPPIREWLSLGNMRSERHSKWDPHLARKKNTDKIRADDDNGRKSNFISASLGDKLKDLKSTRMAANMVDEVADLNEKLEVQETSSTRADGGSTHDNTAVPSFPLPPPPPPPVAGHAYLQYKGKDETVVNDDDDDEMLDVDIV